MADAAPAMLWVTGADGDCRFLSRAWYEYTGQPRGAGLGDGWLKALHVDDRARAGELFEAARAQREPFEVDYRIFRRDGCYRWALAAGRPWFDEEGRYLGYAGSVIDIHERKTAEVERRRLTEELETRVEERTQRLEALGKALVLAEQRERRRLSYVLHDDLQQTLFGIRMRASLLKTHLDDAEGAVEDRLAELQDLVAEALHTTRVLALELNPPVLHHDELGQALAWLAEHMQHAYGLHVVVEGSAAVGQGDLPVLVIQIVRELLLNVSRHAGVGAARVTMAHADGVLHIDVADDGVGFDVSLLEGLDRELSIESARDGRRAALGLISIAERLRLFGGSLTVSTRPGAGATVSLHLPIPGGSVSLHGAPGAGTSGART